MIDNEDTQLLTQLVKMDKLQGHTLEDRILIIGGFITINMGAEVFVQVGAKDLDDGVLWLMTDDFLIDVSGTELVYPAKDDERYLATHTGSYDSWVATL